jgi:hypothetical protein
MTELDKLLGYCGEMDRVCPMPLPWHQVWDILPRQKVVQVGSLRHRSSWQRGGKHQTKQNKNTLSCTCVGGRGMAHWTKWRSFSGPSPKLSGTIVAMPPFEG